MRLCRALLLTLLAMLFVGCASHSALHDGAPRYSVDETKIPNAKPHPLPRSKYGNPSTYVVYGKRYHVLKSVKGYERRGIASWYGTKFHGQLTSSREPYNMLAMTGASPDLPIPCFVRVTNLENGRSIIVKINDRGPFAPNRILDLSYVAAKKLGYSAKGTALVDVKAISFDEDSINTMTPVVTVENLRQKHFKLYLQLGAFHEATNAEHLKLQLTHYISRPVFIAKSAGHTLPFYRVQIGPLRNVDESDKLQALLRTHGFGEAVTIITG